MSIKNVGQYLLDNGALIDNPEWQGIKDIPNMWEVLNFQFNTIIPTTVSECIESFNPDLPWAEDHFEERISGTPTNPGDTYTYWPFYKHDDKWKEGDVFTHTYQERFWPKKANSKLNWGIRYILGDLNDVIKLINRNKYTRQAYLPIFFPEDTGANHGGRIPCTLGYLFYIREGKINCNYYIRSCDYIRHFHNDVYMACRLTQHIRDRIDHEVEVGELRMYIANLHVFETDLYSLKKSLK